MVGPASVSGGAKHGAAVLSHHERVVAQNVLNKLNSPKSGGLHAGLSSSSATVFGGVKGPKLAASALLHGHGSDTFMGGARSVSTHALANIGNDTVVSGSATKGGHMPAESHATHSMQKFGMNSDTINVKGATAESVKGTHPEQAHVGSHTITIADKTTVTVSGLSHHDMGKLAH
jgi:hypothetical protein